MPHVFQVYYPILDEAAAALDSSYRRISPDHKRLEGRSS